MLFTFVCDVHTNKENINCMGLIYNLRKKICDLKTLETTIKINEILTAEWNFFIAKWIRDNVQSLHKNRSTFLHAFCLNGGQKGLWDSGVLVWISVLLVEGKLCQGAAQPTWSW